MDGNGVHSSFQACGWGSFSNCYMPVSFRAGLCLSLITGMSRNSANLTYQMGSWFTWHCRIVLRGPIWRSDTLWSDAAILLLCTIWWRDARVCDSLLVNCGRRYSEVQLEWWNNPHKTLQKRMNMREMCLRTFDNHVYIPPIISRKSHPIIALCVCIKWWYCSLWKV